MSRVRKTIFRGEPCILKCSDCATPWSGEFESFVNILGPPTSTPASATASARVSFADAMLWAAARSAGAATRVYTLDARFPASGIDVRREW